MVSFDRPLVSTDILLAMEPCCYPPCTCLQGPLTSADSEAMNLESRCTYIWVSVSVNFFWALRWGFITTAWKFTGKLYLQHKHTHTHIDYMCNCRVSCPRNTPIWTPALLQVSCSIPGTSSNFWATDHIPIGNLHDNGTLPPLWYHCSDSTIENVLLFVTASSISSHKKEGGGGGGGVCGDFGEIEVASLAAMISNHTHTKHRFCCWFS